MAKLLKIRRDATCARCTMSLVTGTSAHWDQQARTMTCVACVDGLLPTRTPDGAIGNGAVSEVITPVPAATTSALPEARPDVAGRSAASEFQRRASKEISKKQADIDADTAWRSDLRKGRPIVGRFVTALTPRPTHGPLSQSTSAWDKGAVGERRVAEILEAIADVEVLHDRLVPGKGAANIDHIVVSAAGVFVIDAKKYDGTLEVRDKGTWTRSDDRLYVAGRDRTKLTDGVLGQVDAVRSILREQWSDVPIHGILCFVGCDWTRLRPKFINGTTVVWPKALAEHLPKKGSHHQDSRAIAAHLRAKLKQAR